MLLVAGTMTFSPNILDDFRQDVTAMYPDVVEEDGCLHYALLVDDADAGTVNVHEQWRDEDAFLAHLNQPWTLDFFGKYMPLLKDSTVCMYDAGEPRALPGME